MDSISQIRQMMAEQKFLDVQRLIETELRLQNSNLRHELLVNYLEVLKAQDKVCPLIFRLELCESYFLQEKFEIVSDLLNEVTSEEERIFFRKIQKLKLETAARQGQIGVLYNQTASFIRHQFEKKNPAIPAWLESIIKKYFEHDFVINLHILAIKISACDFQKAEELVKELILSSIEKASPKGIKEKLVSISDVLKSAQRRTRLEIYENLIQIYTEGPKNKADLKKVTEMVIYFDDFRFQTLILHLLDSLSFGDIARDYVPVIRNNKDYSFVYFDKYYFNLKKYFHKKTEQVSESNEIIKLDIQTSENYSSDMFCSEINFEENEDEKRFEHLVKHQHYSVIQLCELAVSFIQSEMPRIALAASVKAQEISETDLEYLKASYLKFTALLQLKDYRAALDTCFQALGRAKSQDDILSFLYGKAELYIRLEEPHRAKKILKKILSIDKHYRLAKERLEKLNEI